MPERLVLARNKKLSHEQFFELIMADEVQRRDQLSTRTRARKVKLDPAMVVEAWDDTAKVTFDRPCGESCRPYVSSRTSTMC
jgi:hypothetical protein